MCLSFAGEDRPYVDRVARYLRTKKVRVFYDNDEQLSLWGEDLYAYLDDIYRNKARFCVMFISAAYSRKLRTNHERQSAQARAFRSHQAYILPARFDNTEIPGLRETVGYIDLRELTPAAFAKRVLDKINESKGQTSSQADRTRAPAKKKAPTKQKKAAVPGSRTKVNSSDAWVLLDDTFFLSRSVSDHTNGEIEIVLAVDNPV
ncbi:toll/interleukin-1 receptor domain-containing protein [Candidatus Entotheonella palauensis]|uniref:toll/interleukin-1 receptor domain-containing protein n=1 Tax=Candidatus Entotheonella palauensis TaxID=93172 RepID=UPI0015C4DA79|nr:TIR domain-containing protein [Candidatus Entotheonella palauensis]